MGKHAVPSRYRIPRAHPAAPVGAQRADNVVFARLPVAAYSLDRDRRIAAVSDRWLDLLGYARTEVIGRPIAAFMTSESVARMDSNWDDAVRARAARDLERRFLCKSGEVREVLLSCAIADGAPRRRWRSVCVLIDVTAHRRAEAALCESERRLRQAEKMGALGQLAGGIAHDFHNVLQAVQGGATLLQRRPGEPERVLRIAGTILAAAERGLAITRRLLVFSRRGDLRAEPVDIAVLLHGLADLLVHTLGSGVAVRVEAASGLPMLLADKGQLETVLINLATNARDAMAGQGSLTLTATAEIAADGADRTLMGVLRPGRYIRLSVADTGSGMDADTLERALEPFFTTKPVGQGTGLGLPMAQGFAEQSGGGLHISSAPGQGTTVSLWLPVVV